MQASIDTGSQMVFNPIKALEFTNDWYEFDSKAAHKAALKARNAKARELRKAGRTVTCFSMPSQLVSVGGIGSGNPHIEQIVTCYGLNYR